MGRSPELFNSGCDEYFKIIYSGYYEYFRNINRSYYEWLSGAREYVSSEESALLREWCMRGCRSMSDAHVGCTRLVHCMSGARD